MDLLFLDIAGYFISIMRGLLYNQVQETLFTAINPHRPGGSNYSGMILFPIVVVRGVAGGYKHISILRFGSDAVRCYPGLDGFWFCNGVDAIFHSGLRSENRSGPVSNVVLFLYHGLNVFCQGRH